MVGDKPALTSEKPSKGCFFYIVSPSHTDKNRRYVNSIERPTDDSCGPKVAFRPALLRNPSPRLRFAVLTVTSLIE